MDRPNAQLAPGDTGQVNETALGDPIRVEKLMKPSTISGSVKSKVKSVP